MTYPGLTDPGTRTQIARLFRAYRLAEQAYWKLSVYYFQTTRVMDCIKTATTYGDKLTAMRQLMHLLFKESPCTSSK